ncbi:hypothetical protein [Pseudoalteromonas sp. CH_XMU1449-3]|uniref:hypothetical protein n=1 Tax=Pseudoalteromonas sp. CH_XMU1449-3 TaxID=3107774 RepID=UPI003008A892
MSAALQLNIEPEAVEQAPTLDRKEIVTELMNVRREIALIESAELKSLKERRTELENHLKATLEVGEKVSYAGIGMVSMSEETQPSVQDWDALYEYIKENDAFYFLQRKVNGAPYRELLSTGESLAGVAPVKVRKLSVRKS